MIRIITDSSSDIPPAIAAAHEIRIVPLSIRFGDEEYVDGAELTSAMFWQKLASSDRLPETAAPSAGAFLEAYETLTDEGATGIVAICMSSAISATYQSAVLAAEKVAGDIPIRVIDSQAVTMALGLQVTAAASAAAGGASLDEVAMVAADAAAKSNVFAAFDTLEFLKRGGRVGSGAALLGGLLDVKPLVHFEDGAIAAAGRVRTRSKALAAIVDKAIEISDRLDALAVIHGNAADVDELLDQLRERLPDHNPIVAELGPVVGTHAGPGTIGIAYRLA